MSNLDELTKQQASMEIASIFDGMASLFYMQVGRCVSEVVFINHQIARTPNEIPTHFHRAVVAHLVVFMHMTTWYLR